jgi:hypothetical protein
MHDPISQRSTTRALAALAQHLHGVYPLNCTLNLVDHALSYLQYTKSPLDAPRIKYKDGKYCRGGPPWPPGVELDLSNKNQDSVCYFRFSIQIISN